MAATSPYASVGSSQATQGARLAAAAPRVDDLGKALLVGGAVVLFGLWLSRR